MRAQQLVEIAGWIALTGPSNLRERDALVADALAEYWIASRCRLDDWGRRLRALGDSATAVDASPDTLERLAEEMLVSEVLTRVVAAVSLAHDSLHGVNESASVALNASDAHKQTVGRLRALQLAWWPRDSPRARATASLSRQAERWTDVLLAPTSTLIRVERLAYDPQRVRDFAASFAQYADATAKAAAQLLRHSIRSSFGAAKHPAINPDLNRRIAGAALGLLGQGAFDGVGLLRPAWMIRAERMTDDASAMLASLFSDPGPAATGVASSRWRT